MDIFRTELGAVLLFNSGVALVYIENFLELGMLGSLVLDFSYFS
jgi:hypothetical protein